MGDKMGITFGRMAPENLGGRKNVQNSARFVTTFDFDRKYLWNGSTHRKSEEYFINYNPFHVGLKKIGELWSTNKNVLCPIHTAVDDGTQLFCRVGVGGVNTPVGSRDPVYNFLC